MKTRHILHVVESIEMKHGGPAVSATQLAMSVNQLDNYRCSVFVPKPTSEIVPIDKSLNTVFFEQGTSLFGWAIARRLKELYEQDPFDVVHVHGIWQLILHHVCSFCQRNKIKYLVAPRGMLEAWSLNQKKVKKQIAMFLYQKNDLNKAEAIHVTAESEAKSLRNIGFNNTFIVPNGVEIPAIQHSKSKKKTALFLSRLHPKKGIPLLLEAWGKNETNEWQLLIAGPGDPRYVEKLKTIVDELRLNENVKILPPVFGDEKWKLYRQANLFVLPTYSENFGIVVAESLAMETPVLTTTGTPWTELDEVGCGWCIELSSKTLVDTLQIGIGMSIDQLHEMGKKGRKYVIENFAWQTIGKEMANCYQSILVS